MTDTTTPTTAPDTAAAPAQETTAQAVEQGVMAGLQAAMPAVATAAMATNPNAALVVGTVTALEPAIAQIIAMQQVGLLTPAQQAQVIAALQANCVSAHQAWLASIAAHPGT